MPKPCAYCDQFRELTKEHLAAAWLAEENEGNSLEFSARADKIFDDESRIRDTCKPCNNVHLSKLDAYVKTLYLKYFSLPVREADAVSFEFDYHLLTRWLLKVSFNSARINGDVAAVEVYRPLRNYILYGTPVPHRIRVYLQLVTTSIFTASELGHLDDEKLKKVPKNPAGRYEMLPHICHASEAFFGMPITTGLLCRNVGIRYYEFFLLIPRRAKVPIRTLVKGCRTLEGYVDHATLLTPTRPLINVPASDTTARTLNSASMDRNRQVFYSHYLEQDIRERKDQRPKAG